VARVALVASWLNQYGGAERVLEVLHDMFPTAPVYTSMYSPQAMPPSYRSWDIRTTFMQHVPGVTRKHQLFLPLYPLAFESLHLNDYDLVISNTSAFAHGVHTESGISHICYCLTPARFLWDYERYVEREQLGRLPRTVLPSVIGRLRSWDHAAAQRVTQYVAISRLVAERIRTCYGRDSAIIYPPLDAHAFSPADSHDDYYLIVSRLIPYKRIDLAVQACTELGMPLRIIGDGRDRPRLERMAGPTVQFLGRLPDADLKQQLSHCRAFIFPGEEDFGLAPLEAMASGRPVIAYAGGGALETVADNVTGTFFYEPNVQSLSTVLSAFDASSFDPAAIRRHSERFDRSVFAQDLRSVVQQKTGLSV
jgi:glycosyltransferase involved in cell wall biosynthesis